MAAAAVLFAVTTVHPSVASPATPAALPPSPRYSVPGLVPCSWEIDLTANARYVAFDTKLSLATTDTNGTCDVYVWDVVTDTYALVSIGRSGRAASGDSQRPSISNDGRYVAFTSTAADLVAKDTNGAADVFLRDRTAGATTLVSATAAGVQGNGASLNPDLAPSAGYVAFATDATNLVKNDSNGVRDVLRWTRATKALVRVSVADNGAQLGGPSQDPSVSNDGARVAFVTKSTADGLRAVLVRDATAKHTYSVPKPCAVDPPCTVVGPVSISADGTRVAFASVPTMDDSYNGKAVLMPATGGALIEQSDENVCPYDPGVALSQDGTAFTGIHADCYDEFSVYGTGAMCLTDPTGAIALNRNGRYIAFSIFGDSDQGQLMWADGSGIC